MDIIEQITSFIGCEYEIIETAKGANAVMNRYLEMQAKGKEEGFTPVIIIPCDVMCEATELFYKDHNISSPHDIIEISKSIDAVAFLKQRLEDVMTIIDDPDLDIEGEYEEPFFLEPFFSWVDFDENQAYEELILAKIPTSNPWEVAAWIPTMAGVNECPFPAE